ncbi:MAG: exosortase T [Candidatus Competibacteraceae bacterium]|jgi:exosortase/archaeosortase family protein|nr:exosortase T [Candidatus Competibacteraceae bacterium]
MVTRVLHYGIGLLAPFRPEFSGLSASAALFGVGALVLAAEPVAWLVRTWFDPVYGSHGLPVFLLVLLLFGWSLTSPQQIIDERQRPWALGLFMLTALVRLSGQVLAINTLGALILALDVYALGLLAGLHNRRRSLAPGWLAVVFIFALPLERVIQRSIGFVLQQFSAAGACFWLDLGFSSVECQGVRILLNGHDVLVDLPCSGARSLLLLLLLFATLAALLRPTLIRAGLGLLLTLIAAVTANVLRICLLAIGIAFPEQVGISVMAAPWHDLIGLLSLALGALPVLIWAFRTLPRQPVLDSLVHTGAHSETQRNFKLTPVKAGGFIVIAAVIVWFPAHPVDVSRPTAAPVLPVSLAGVPGQAGQLTPLESSYFTQYGGGAARSRYGDLNLLLVRTAAPLRHLHAPDECLTGLGHQVEYLGPTYTTIPTAIYRSTDPQGQLWRVAVTFYSSQGQLTTNVAEAVWLWLQDPTSTWTMIQRVTPWDIPTARIEHWDQAAALALDLPLTSDSFPPTEEPQS